MSDPKSLAISILSQPRHNPADLRAELLNTEVTLAEIRAWRVGTVVELPGAYSTDSRIAIEIDGELRAHGRVVERDGRLGVEVEMLVAPSSRESSERPGASPAGSV